jgi:hypothetical protein
MMEGLRASPRWWTGLVLLNGVLRDCSAPGRTLGTWGPVNGGN